MQTICGPIFDLFASRENQLEGLMACIICSSKIILYVTREKYFHRIATLNCVYMLSASPRR
jgi:hypothetical protein